MKMKLIMCVTMLAFLSVLNVKNVSAVPILTHEYNDINVFDACAYYIISDFSTLKNFSENTLYTHSKNEVTGSVKNGLWEYEYLEPYTVQVLEKPIKHIIEECIDMDTSNISKDTNEMICNNVTYYNQTWKDKILNRSLWLNASYLLTDNSKLSSMRFKSTQNIRFCADIERVWTPEGFTIKVDVIPHFDGFIYYSYAWFDDSFGFKMAVLGFCPHCSASEDILLLVNNDTSNIGVFIDGSLELFSGNFTVNSTWQIIGYIYFNDFTDYVLVDPTETFQIGMFIDEGNSTSFGQTELNLMCYLPLDCTGTNCLDLSRYECNGTKNGINDPLEVPGMIGRGQLFDSANSEFITLPFSPPTNTWTFSSWIRQSGNVQGALFAWADNLGRTKQLYVTGALNRVQYAEFNGTLESVETTRIDISGNEWIMVTLTKDGTNATIYMNGVLNISGTVNRQVVGIVNLGIGAILDGSPATFFNGTIDNVKIWNRTLTPDEILMEYNNTAGIHNVTDIGDIEIRPPIPTPQPSPPQIHSFIIYKLINPQIPFIGWFLESLTFKAVILFMDRLTVAGNVDIGENLNVTGNWSGNDFYGEMWFHNDQSNVTTTINTQGVYVNVTGFDTGELTGQTLNGFSYFTDTLVAQVAGKYDIEYSLSFGNVGNNQEYQMHIAINDIHQNQTDAHRKVGASGDVGNSGSSGFIDLEIGDHINLHIRNNDGTGDVVSHASNVNLIRIGD